MTVPDTVTVCALLLVVLAVVLRQVEGTWLTPGALFAAYWATWLGGTALFGRGYRTPAVGPAFIVLAVVAVAAGARAASPASADRSRRVRVHQPLVPRGMAVAGGAAAVAATALMLADGGYSLGSVLSLQGLLATGNQLSVDRYANNGVPALVPWLLSGCYAGALVGPFLLAGDRRHGWGRQGLLVCLPLLGALSFSTVTTARLPLLLTACFTAISVVMALSLREGRVFRPQARHAAAAVLAVAGVASAFALIAFVRIGTADSADRPVIADKLQGYAFGGVPAFSQWLEQPDPPWAGRPRLTYGQATLGAPARALGYDASLSQAYTDPRQVTVQPGDTTNIFTAFRSLVGDFGVAGALLVLAGLGAGLARLQRRVLRGGLASFPLVAAGYGYLLNSNSQSIFWFTNVLVALVLAGGLLAVAAARPAGRPRSILR